MSLRILGQPGPLMRYNQIYNSVIVHTLVIIFFTVIPFIIGGFGNLLVPLILGALEIAFPRINNKRF
jgi:heme/copper-type cytochrome/quinol oxidase subunit 1